MLTRDDIQVAKATCDTLLANLTLLDRMIKEHMDMYRHDHDDNSQRVTQPLRGLIGVAKSHIKSLLQFPAENAEVVDKVFSNLGRKSAINVGLPYVIEKLPPSIDLFKPYLKDEDAKLLCDAIKKDLAQLAENIAELKKNPKSSDENHEDVAQLKPR